MKTSSTKDETARNTTDRIATDYKNILVFLQAVALKAPIVQAAELSLQTDKRAKIWFHQWANSNLKYQAPPNKAEPYYHSGLTGVLSEVATRL